MACSFLRNVWREIRRYLCLLGLGFPSDRSVPTEENEVSSFLLFLRNALPDSLQWWHPSVFASVVINLYIKLVKWYRIRYYWPAWLKAPGLSEAGARGRLFRNGILFHSYRTGALVFFVVMVGVHYRWAHSPWLAVRLSPACHALISLAFVLLVIDSLLYQSADLATFLHADNMTVISILLCRQSFRDSLWTFRRDYWKGNYGTMSSPHLPPTDIRFHQRVKEHVEEVGARRPSLKVDVLRLAVLPLRHVARFLVIWAFMVLSLQVYYNGCAYSHLRLHEDRTMASFGLDTLDCLYYSAITVSTIGYGDVFPSVEGIAEGTDKECARPVTARHITQWVRTWTLLAAIVIIATILATFSLSFRIVHEVMDFFDDPEKIKRAVHEFILDPGPYPIIQ